jgi:UDP-N-acetylmuramate--alanine ligase
LIGIAGAGMQALARVLLDRGWQLSGSDQSAHVPQWLSEAGVAVARGHAAKHLPPDVELVIYSGAVGVDVPERRAALHRGIPLLSYAESLGQLMTGKQGLAIAGTHGKSTTTAMAAQILVAAGLDPTVIFGASRMNENCGGGRAGRGNIALVEACEYRANFLHLAPQTAVILGIEPDHFDYYPSQELLEGAFREFVELVPTGGLVIARDDCPATGRVVANLACRVETFGLGPGSDWQAVDLRAQAGHYEFTILHGGHDLGRVRLPVCGRHQVLNALAAAAVSRSAGASAASIREGLSRFSGLKRRMERVAGWPGITWIDDYAHHPTEIAAALGAVREMCPRRKLWCIFEPHQASRTQHLLDEFASSLHNADHVAVVEIFRAREGAPRPDEVRAEDLAARVRAAGRNVLQVHRPQDILEQINDAASPGDVVLTLGAGNLRNLCDEFVDRLRTYRAAG